MLTKRTPLLILFEFLFMSIPAQDNATLEANVFRGNAIPHDNTLHHLTTGIPKGFILSWNKYTNGEKTWQARFNYPDIGLSLVYQDYDNRFLGYNASLNGHYNFYFFKRHLLFRVGQGIGWSSRPFDRETNPKNIAISTHITSSTYLMLNYKKRKLLDNIGFQTGLTFTHNSLGSMKAPNKGINSVLLNFGLFYDLSNHEREFIPLKEKPLLDKKVRYNFVLRGGINEYDVVGSGQFPFFVFSGYASKKLSHVSGLQLGADLFLSYFLKERIEYEALLEESRTDADTDFKRASIFAGHEIYINKLSVISQIGYYFYYPFEFAEPFYFRIGMKYYFSKRLFGALTLKSHAADAEALEFGLGIRL